MKLLLTEDKGGQGSIRCREESETKTLPVPEET